MFVIHLRAATPRRSGGALMPGARRGSSLHCARLFLPRLTPDTSAGPGPGAANLLGAAASTPAAAVIGAVDNCQPRQPAIIPLSTEIHHTNKRRGADLSEILALTVGHMLADVVSGREWPCRPDS
jgi:hypothetical protein